MSIIEHLQQQKVLLDTHIWLWLLEGHHDLSPDFINVMDESFERDTVFISPISIWEVGMLVNKKRVVLEMDCLDWVNHALDGINMIPISPQIAIQSTRLPGNVHGDPADRILIATAHIENLVLVTCDQKILDYGTDRFISVHCPIKTQ